MKRLWLALAITAITVPFAIAVRFDTRPFAALGDGDPAFATLARFLAEREMLVVLLEGDGALLDAARETYDALSKEPLLAEVVGKLSPDDASALIDSAYLLWPAANMHRLESALSHDAIVHRVAQLQASLSLPGGRAMLDRAFVDPLDLGPELMRGIASGGESVIDGSSGFMVSNDIVSFFARPKAPSHDGAATRALFARLQTLGRTVAEKHPGITLRMTGPHIFAAEYEQRLTSGLGLSGMLSLLLVVGWCIVLLGDIGFMAIAGATLALSAVWTMGVAGLVFSQLQILAVSAASILPAIGIDAAVQFHAAFVGQKGSALERVDAAFAQMQRPILVAAGASFVGFLAFVFADVAAFRQFGALLAIGVVANTVAMFTVLPGACLLLARLRPRWLERVPRRGFLEAAGARLARASGWTRYLPVAFAAIVVLARPAIETHFGFSALVEPTMAGAVGQRTFERAFSASERHLFVLIEAPTRDAAIEAERAFSAALMAEDDLPLARERMALLAVTARDRERAAALTQRRAPAVVATELRAALDEAGFAEDVVARMGSRVEAMTPSAQLHLPPIARFFAEQRLLERNDGAVTYVSLFLSPRADVERTVVQLRALAASVPGAKLTVTGPALIDVTLHRALTGDGFKLTALALLGALLALFIARMPFARVMIAASALVLVFVALYGVLAWCAIPLTLVTLLVFPFVLGVGIDASVYLLDHADFAHDGTKLLREHLRPLLASTLTTLSGFLALLFVPLVDIRRLGLAVALGLGLALLTSLTWVMGFARRR